jgi:hypothetical protein
VLAAAQWFVEDEASAGFLVWDETWLWAGELFKTWPPPGSGYRGTEDEWIVFLIGGVAIVAATRLIRRPQLHVLMRAAGWAVALTAIGCWLGAWDVLMVARLALMPATTACIGYAAYVSAVERRSIFLQPPAWPPMWWLGIPAIACVGSWFVVILLARTFGAPPVLLLAVGIAVVYGAAKQVRNPSIRVIVKAVAGTVAVVGLDAMLGLGLPVFPLLFSLAVTCAVAAVWLAFMRIVRRSPNSAPA